MSAKITVNGVRYDSVEAMPAEARRIYEQALANLPAPADQGTGEITDIREGGGSGLHIRTVVRKKLIVNGTAYEDESAMPADVHQAWQRAMGTIEAGDPVVKQNDIKLSFKITGPGLEFHKLSSEAPENSGGTPRSRPIEPEGLGQRFTLSVIAGGAAVLLLWLLFRSG